MSSPLSFKEIRFHSSTKFTRTCLIIGSISFVILVAFLVHCLPSNPWDADTAYHLVVARLLRQQGILHSFPWTPFSWLSDNYADKELLFHIFLIPFCQLFYTNASFWAGATAGSLVLITFLWILRSQNVSRAVLWAVMPLVASGAFLFRFLCVRPHLFSIALATIILWAAATKRWRVLAVASFLYPLAYVGWPISLGLVLLAEIARKITGTRWEWKGLVICAAALALGLVVHPNFPNIARFSWLVNVGILLDTAWASRAGFDLGGEFRPFSLLGVGRFLLIPILFTGTTGFLWIKMHKLNNVALAFLLASLVFLGLTLRTQRFVEYFAPFSTLALAFAFGDWPKTERNTTLLFLGAFLITLIVGAVPVRRMMMRRLDVSPPMAQLLRKTIPPGAQVFTCEWGLTGELMRVLPERRFLVALDPVLFYAKDPQRYALWRNLISQEDSQAAKKIRNAFGAQFVLCVNKITSIALFQSLNSDSTVRPVISGPLWRLYDLAGNNKY